VAGSVRKFIIETRIAWASRACRQSAYPEDHTISHSHGPTSEADMLVRHVVENTYLNATVLDLDGGERIAAK